MEKKQKALIIDNWAKSTDNKSLNQLNEYLENGWHVIIANPMSGSDTNTSYSLIIIEKNI